MCQDCYNLVKQKSYNEPYWKFINRPATMIGVVKRLVRLNKDPAYIISKYFAEIEGDEIEEFKILHSQLLATSVIEG